MKKRTYEKCKVDENHIVDNWGCLECFMLEANYSLEKTHEERKKEV